jgi:LysR family transcriptional regulator, glycine cleavage system transcriptional activator
MSSPVLPPLASLRAFEAIARFGSVKLASESLNLTPSAISHQLRALEAHFGVQLVQRNGRNVVLTESGAVYAAAVLTAFNELFRASDLLDARKRDRLVRVSVTPTFATLAALPHLEQFRMASSNFDLRLEARNTPVDFVNDTIDAAIQLATPPMPGLILHRLFRSRIAPCAAPNFLERFGPIRTIEDLSKLSLIEFSTAPKGWRAWFQANAPELSLAEPELVGDSLLTGLQMARSGMGVILAPFPLVSPMITSGALKVLALWQPLNMDSRDFYFTYRKVDEISTRIKVVHQWLNLVVRSLEAESTLLGIGTNQVGASGDRFIEACNSPSGSWISRPSA